MKENNKTSRLFLRNRMREKDEIFSINAFILMTKCKFYKELVWHPTPVCLENPMEGGAWKAAVHGVTEGQTRLSDFTFTHWRRKWQSTPVFLPGESQGQGSLVGCRLWGRTESDTTEAT